MYKRGLAGWLKHWDFMLWDIICLQIAFILAFLLRHGTVVGAYTLLAYRRFALATIIIHVAATFFMEPYSGIIRRSFGREARKSSVHATTIFLSIILYEVIFKLANPYSRIFIFSFWLISFACIWFGRSFLKRIVRRRLTHAKDRPVLIIVTLEKMAEEIIAQMKKDRYHEFQLGGLVLLDVDRTGETVRGLPIVSSADAFYEYARLHVVDEVFISCDNIRRAELYAAELIEMGITVHLDILSRGNQLSDRLIERCAGYLVLTSSLNIASPSKLFIKRITDIAGSLIGLVLTGIAFLIFAPIIKRQSPGPIFFTQERVGRNGRTFRLYKFRSMKPNAEKEQAALSDQNEMEGYMFKLADDPRIIPIGHFMRRYSIDELPQFWNVLKGDMSLVGTRPPTVEEFQQYEAHHKARLGFRPGLTGLWQVSGRSAITDFEQVVKLDTKYITEWSLGLDFQIIFRTIEVVLRGRGS